MAFPAIEIDGQSAALLEPYRHATKLLEGLGGIDCDLWDAAFASLGCRWGRPILPLTDPFLAGLTDDGFVPSRLDRPGVPAPPLAAVAEWARHRLSPDVERLEHAFALLWRDFRYRQDHLRKRNGLFRGDVESYRVASTARFSLGGRVVPSLAEGASWVDASAMHAFNARILGRIAGELGRKGEAGELEWAFRDISARINATMWREEDGFYHDLDEHGDHLPVRSLASIWPVWAGVAPRNRALRLLGMLSDVSKFERAHSFATVAATESEYRRRDGTPVGVVRPDFNLLCYEAMHAYDKGRLADQMARLHLRRVGKVLADAGEIYGAYDPDSDAPAPLPDGSSGADSSVIAAELVQITLSGLVGLRPEGGGLALGLNIPEGFKVEGAHCHGGEFAIEVAPAAEAVSGRKVEVMSEASFKLKVAYGKNVTSHEITPGSHTIQA